MCLLMMQGIAEPEYAKSIVAEATQTQLRTRDEIAELESLTNDSSTESMSALASRYVDLNLMGVKFNSQGEYQQSHQLDTTHIDPIENALWTGMAAADRKFSEDAKKASLEAIVGTVASLLFGAAALVALFLKLERSVRSSSELMSRQSALVQAERHWSSLIQNVSEIVSLVDASGKVTFASPAITKLLGRSVVDIVGHPLHELVLDDDVVVARAVIERAQRADSIIKQEWRLKSTSGGILTCEISFNNLLADPDVRGILVTLRDVSERHEFEQQLTHQAFHDVLTGLPNRALFADRVRGALERSKRSGLATGLLFIDLDNFKVVNDSLGHEEGDRLLIELGLRLKSCVRSCDTVARLGGDEFTILVEDIATEEDLVSIARTILECLRAPIALQGRSLVATASIGLALSEVHSDPDGLMRDADTAMYHAKTNGKAGYAIFNRAMSAKVLERLDLEGDLRVALEKNELHLAYQPICALSSNRITGIEALIRWQHPTRGLIPPLTFIPIAEESGLIIPLGEWVLRTACTAAAEWVAKGDVDEVFAINVNVSSRQLLEANFVERVMNTLSETHLNPKYLKLEITESMIMQNLDDCVLKMRTLREAGVRFAIDDFGTGYSSMSYLTDLPVDTLKIDRSFVNRIGDNADGDAIIRAILTMAQALGLNVTSEGIETTEQLRYLNLMGCEQGQGFLFAKPLEHAEITDILMKAHDDLTSTLLEAA
jgi:diguanylate cyclase (GGDEF)-like protein/PAS domain S-box-containing protein